MAKYKQGNFYQGYKVIDDLRFNGLPYQCIYIFKVMEELEHRYTSKESKRFYRSNSDMARDCKMALSTFMKYKKLLCERNIELIEKGQPLFYSFHSDEITVNSKAPYNKQITHYIMAGKKNK